MGALTNPVGKVTHLSDKLGPVSQEFVINLEGQVPKPSSVVLLGLGLVLLGVGIWYRNAGHHAGRGARRRFR